MVDQRLIEQVLDSPPGRNVVRTPIATAILFQDPSSAGQVVAYLDGSERRSSNTLALLAFYDERALSFFLDACSRLSSRGKALAVDALYPMLSGLAPLQARTLLGSSVGGLLPLLLERAPMPFDVAAGIEVDFLGRVCDDCYIVLQALVDPEGDISIFIRSTEEERDGEIQRFIRRLSRAGIV
jgi:hypothetical protein